MENYSMFRYFKGQEENPYDQVYQNAQYMFWGYESMFDFNFNKADFKTISWVDEYSPYFKKWETVLSQNPVNKQDLFELWLYELLAEHLPDKNYSTKDKFMNLYYHSKK